MLEIKQITNLGEIEIVKRNTKKKQILLYDTKRRVNNYINRIKYRKITNYTEIPNYIICKNGDILEVFNPKYYSKMFYTDIDKRQIKIAMENLGWLTKNPLNGTNSNWLGEKTRIEPFFKKWRGIYYWDNYTTEQMDSLSLLTDKLTKDFDIPNRKFGNNGYFGMATEYEGILYKSNFSDIYKDINPSFNFK